MRKFNIIQRWRFT